MPLHNILLAAALGLGLAAPALADEAAARGLEIAEEADRRDEGWGDSTTTRTMTPVSYTHLTLPTIYSV